jgi:hypothetical protein
MFPGFLEHYDSQGLQFFHWLSSTSSQDIQFFIVFEVLSLTTLWNPSDKYYLLRELPQPVWYAA